MLKNAQIKIGATNIKIEKSTANTEKSATILKSGIMNNYDEIRGSNIEAQSVLVNSMGIDLRSARYLLQAYLRVNYLDDINSVYGSSGVLIHKDIDIVWGGVFDLEHQTWTIAAPQTFTLDPAKYYWAYIKCDILTGEATWHLSETKLLANEVEGYYMFEWGQIMPVVEGERLVQQTYGSTYLMHSPVTIAAASASLASIDGEQVLTVEEQTGTDEKVKFDAADTAAGYLSEKIIPGTNITIDEGTGTDENKLKISATVDPGIKVAFDFITTAELYFVYKCPQAMVFTSQESEHTAATISPVIGTNLAQYDTVTITAVETGLIILNGNTL